MSSDQEQNNSVSEGHSLENGTSQCPECKQKYRISSGSSSASSNERIVIPIRKDLIQGNTQVEQILHNLQNEIQNLKHSNIEKDRTIEQLRKQIDHKMTHYILQQKLKRQEEEICALKNQISFGSNCLTQRNLQNQNNSINSKRNQFDENVRSFIKSQKKNGLKRNYSQGEMFYDRKKIHSTLDNYQTLRRQYKKNSKNKEGIYAKTRIPKQFASGYHEEYFLNSKKDQLKSSEPKKIINVLEAKIQQLEKQVNWMKKFVSAFTTAMENVAYLRYQQRIIMPEWSLKKKAKVSWRYLKHLLKFFYEQNTN